MTEPKGLLDVALAGVKKGSYEVYDIELPNGLKIRTDGSDAEHQRVRQTITDLEKVGTHEKNPGDGAGDWFNRTFLRKACKIVDPAKSFHSFRHSFASWAERSGLSDARIARLTGHSSGGSVLRKHYIQVATLQERSEDIGKIRFPAVQAKVLKSNFFEPYFKRLRAVEARKKRTS